MTAVQSAAADQETQPPATSAEWAGVRRRAVSGRRFGPAAARGLEGGGLVSGFASKTLLCAAVKQGTTLLACARVEVAGPWTFLLGSRGAAPGQPQQHDSQDMVQRTARQTNRVGALLGVLCSACRLC